MGPAFPNRFPMTRAFWLLAAVVSLPLVAVSALRAVFKRRPRAPDLRVVGRDCGRPGCPECGVWRERMGVSR